MEIVTKKAIPILLLLVRKILTFTLNYRNW